jgi:hypothetical protein
MNTFTKTLITLAMILAALVLAPPATAQTILSTTTLGAAISTANCSQATFTVASTSTMQGAGTQNNPQTVIYVDKEYDWVQSVTDSTHIVVNRCKGIGASVVPRTHANGATVWFANASAPNSAASFGFKNEDVQAEVSGSCTANLVLGLPIIYLKSGDRFDCSPGGWMQTNAPGVPVLGAVYTVPAGTIVPTGSIFLTDTGTNQATGIAVPNGAGAGFQITIIPGGAFTTTTSGGLANIRIASTAVAGKALIFTYDGSKWDPSY